MNLFFKIIYTPPTLTASELELFLENLLILEFALEIIDFNFIGNCNTPTFALNKDDLSCYQISQNLTQYNSCQPFGSRRQSTPRTSVHHVYFGRFISKFLTLHVKNNTFICELCCYSNKSFALKTVSKRQYSSWFTSDIITNIRKKKAFQVVLIMITKK